MIISALFDIKAFWLVATNLLFGSVVLVCVMTIGWCMIHDIRRNRKQNREESLVPTDYLDGLAELGVALSDGEERIDETEKV